MKKNYFILIALLLLGSCDTPISSSENSESISESISSSISESSSSEKIINAVLTVEDILDVDFHTKKQKEFLAGSSGDIASYAKGVQELSKPKATKITWTNDTTNVPNSYLAKFKGYKLYLYEDENKSNPKIYTSDHETTISVNNLYLNHTYYYEVTATYGDYEFTSNLAKLVTSDSIVRNLDIDGVTNVRDLGNYQTKFDKRVKQGMIYRSAKFNTNYSQIKLITETGLDTVLNDLKIKTEIDLRSVYKSLERPDYNENGSLTASVLGESVAYYQINYSYSTTDTFSLLYSEPNKTGAYTFFKLLANPDNYPIDFHCSIGTDRTGYLGFLTLALLGVDLENLYKDYLFSNFGNIGGSRDKTNISTYMIGRLNKLEGDDLTEKVETYLLSIGITQEEIDTIRATMLE